MDIEARLRSLESRYRKALSGAIAAKAHYMALLDEPGSTPASIERVRSQWETLDVRRREIAARMGELDDLGQQIDARSLRPALPRVPAPDEKLSHRLRSHDRIIPGTVVKNTAAREPPSCGAATLSVSRVFDFSRLGCSLSLSASLSDL